MAIRIFRPADPYQNRTAPRGPVSQGIGKGRFRDDAILGLRPALRLQGKYGGPYPAGPQIDAAFRNDEHPERNGQTIRRDFEFLGQGRTRRSRNTSTTGIFLIYLFCRTEKLHRIDFLSSPNIAFFAAHTDVIPL